MFCGIFWVTDKLKELKSKSQYGSVRLSNLRYFLLKVSIACIIYCLYCVSDQRVSLCSFTHEQLMIWCFQHLKATRLTVNAANSMCLTSIWEYNVPGSIYFHIIIIFFLHFCEQMITEFHQNCNEKLAVN